MLLSAFSRPVTKDGKRVAPEDLEQYRKAHCFKLPCCLCARNENAGIYTEAAIYIPIWGPSSGKYVAGCARKICGYFGMSRAS